MENDQNLVGGLITALRSVEDPRIDRSKLYPLIEMLFLTTSTVLSGFEDWDEIVDFGEEKIAWLRKYLPFEQGIPSHDTVNRVISLIDHRVFEECFVNWATMDIELPSGTVISIDGKKLRSNSTKTSHAQGGKSAIHVVHAWRKESCLCRVLPAGVLPEWAQWPDWVGLKSVVEIQSKRIILSTGVEENETRYYISSLVADSQAFNRLIRSHWNVENQLHWSLDVIFGEDQSRKRVRNAAQNFSTIRKMALNLLKAQTEKISVNRKRNRCALSDQYREKTLGI